MEGFFPTPVSATDLITTRNDFYPDAPFPRPRANPLCYYGHRLGSRVCVEAQNNGRFYARSKINVGIIIAVSNELHSGF